MPPRHSIVTILAFAVSIVAPARALAQATSHDTLGAVVVTATREPVASAVPTATTTVLRGDDLRAAGITRVADALRLVPGASVVGSGSVGSQTSLFLRGGNSDYVRVLIDGVPVNDAGGGFDFSTLTTANIDRIEVLRGPASVLYGSDAVTGVIQLFTRQGAGPLHWSALAGGG
ncbi:MAG: TonB-dependent receptor, partial [Gemmatimonadetes bacterium]|nr:TonB-dependent receptor [Gemmatimonadota bacterium]